jgi:hypothetical protein
VIDIDDPLATSRADEIPQQHLGVFDRAAPESWPSRCNRSNAK